MTDETHNSETPAPRGEPGLAPHGHHGGRHHKRGKRGKRLFDYGELRLLILSMISSQPSHGYELIKGIEERFSGSYTPSPGVIYPTLTWLEDMGFAEIVADSGARKRYRATEDGLAFLKANHSALEQMRTRTPCGPRKDVPAPVLQAMDNLKSALRQRFRQGAAANHEETGELAHIINAAAQTIAARQPAGPEGQHCQPRDPAARHTTERNRMPHSQTEQTNTEAPVVERIRHELRRRELTVKSAEYITPRMLRIELEGDALGDFISLGADDHIKIMLPTGGDKPDMREYTPRRYSNEAKTLTLDFAIHDAGPATAWALGARPGDKLEIGGPRGSAVIHGDTIEHWVLIGDETALPAIGRRIEEAGKGVKITSIVTVLDENEHQRFETKADHEAIWVHRPQSAVTDATGIIEVLKTLEIRPRTYFWIASETSVTRAVRTYLTEEAGVPLPWMKAAGYWLKGQADTSDKSM